MLRFLVLAILCLSSTQAWSQYSNIPVEGELLPGWREADGRHMSGLRLELAPGWKTYWRAPGAGGIPPRFNWTGSQNVADIDVMYPVPKVMLQHGLRSIGYDSDVVFPLVVTARDASAPISLRGEIEVGVCEEVCIPMSLQLIATLPPTGAYDASIDNSMKNQPEQAGAFDCEISPISDGLRLRAATQNADLTADIAVIETTAPGVWVSPSETAQNGTSLVAEVEMVPPSAQPFALARSEVRMTLIGGGRAIELRGCR